MRPALLALFGLALAGCATSPAVNARRPNILILLPDQWRAQAFGYAGDPNIRTPNLDRLAGESANFCRAVSGLPVCCPCRASLMTGRRPLTHGVFMNDVSLPASEATMADFLAREGYGTGYIGKWHLDGRGRSSFTPPERRRGFQYWKALECSHDYNRSAYYADTPEKLFWEGYDTIAQTRDAQSWLRTREADPRPFFLVVAWGTPHSPYATAPEKFRAMYDPAKIQLRANVPATLADRARKDLAGYYAHGTAIDDMVGDLLATLRETGLEENTIVLFTSDHGDLVGSHGAWNKQQPYEESIRVPMLVHWPRGLGRAGRRLDAPINSEDVLPTLLGLCGIAPPAGVEGLDYAPHLRGGPDPSGGTTLITCVQPFGQWNRPQHGAREYRGVVTGRHTYVRDLNGPWLLFDNEKDPFQLENLAGRPEFSALQAELEDLLSRKLRAVGDEFRPGPAYLEKWGYKVDATGTVPYKD
jgi:arylsulfatase A-like enzyme